MAYQCIDLRITDKIAHVVLNRPTALNTFQPVLWRELEAVLDSLQREGSARVLVLSSTGKHFSAGMALDVFGADENGAVSFDDQSAGGRACIGPMLDELQATFSRFEALRMPVIAAIHGACVGAALDMVTACDIRLCTADAFFCIQEINIGMIADVGTLQRLPKLIPEGIVHELAYTGRRLDARRALAAGLVNEVFESQDAMLAAALQMAREIVDKPPVAIWGSKQAIHHARDHATRDALQQMGWLQAGFWQTSNLVEAFKAKQEGRAARYDDLPPLRSFLQANYTLK
jgi:enoyl-CoA hydratase